MSDLTENPERRKRAKTARLALLGFAAAAVVICVAAIIAAAVKTPTVAGVAGGVFGGLFAGLVVMGAGAWVAMAIMRGPRVAAPVDMAAANALHAAASDVLDEMEAARQDTVRQVKARAMWRVPLCVAGGVALWVIGLINEPQDADLFELVAMVVFGLVAGYFWASLKLSSAYARLYKDKVLPRLAAGFGDITYRAAVGPDMGLLKAEKVFRDFDSVSADDQLVGVHRGLPVTITEVKLEKRNGKNTQTIFDGLIVQVELPKSLTGITAVVADGGPFGNFADRMTTSGRQRVKLEDPVFEKVYETYGTDQVSARALLNPAFMERLLKLGERPGYMRPLALAVDNRLTMALPKANGRNLFEPPSFNKPAASREVLVQLRDDIQAVLDVTDAVIALDAPGRVAG